MVRPVISDHALVRWIERTGLAEVEPLRELLAALLERAFTAGTALESSHFLIIADGLVYVIKNGTLVTVLPDSGHHGAVMANREGSGA